MKTMLNAIAGQNAEIIGAIKNTMRPKPENVVRGEVGNSEALALLNSLMRRLRINSGRKGIRMATLREKIKAAIELHPANAELAAIEVCKMLDDRLSLSGNGWFDDDQIMLKELGLD